MNGFMLTCAVATREGLVLDCVDYDDSLWEGRAYDFVRDGYRLLCVGHVILPWTSVYSSDILVWDLSPEFYPKGLKFLLRYRQERMEYWVRRDLLPCYAQVTQPWATSKKEESLTDSRVSHRFTEEDKEEP